MADDKARQDEARKAAIAAAQALEKRGQADAAIQAFLQVGASEEAARVMVGQRRFGEAAQLLLDTVGVQPDNVAGLDATKKKIALQAAICLGRAGDATRAALWFVALGERERAADALRKVGDRAGADRVLAGGPVVLAPPVQQAAPTSAMTTAQAFEAQGSFEQALEAYLTLRQPQHAGRVAAKLGRFAQAAELFISAGMHYEAAEAFWRGGDARQSLDALVRVPKEDPRYRQCCLLVIRLATDLDVLDFQLDHFLTRFLSDAPRDERELDAFYQAGRLYHRHDHLENAKDAYRKVLAIAPAYRDTKTQLDVAELEGRGSAMVYEKILREEEEFRNSATRAPSAPSIAMGLPDLPALPDLPPVPSGGPAETFATVASSRTSGISGPPRAPSAPPVRPSGPPVRPSGPPVRPSGPPVRPSGPPVAPNRPISTPPMAVEQLLAVGATVADRYKLEAKIGQGGMASVFRAHDLELQEHIALKVFTQKVDDEQLVARFKQELSLSRQLNHPNIIRLYDIGAVQGFRYITMELLSGSDLKSKLGKPIDVHAGIDILLQTCSALQHVHEKGVVHRDIKPANLFLTDDGVIKLMDFGIAKRQATPGLTVAGMIAGTPEYMSPEQINGFEKVTASTDLYAVGIMAYEIFTGAVPFRHKDLMPLLMMQMKDKPPRPSLKNPAVSADLEEIILKLLEKDPARRFASCAELAAALQLL